MRWHYVLLFFMAYTTIYIFLVFGTLADGHGTFVFASPLIVWPLFAAALFLVPYAHRKGVLWGTVAIISLHYILTVVIGIVEQSGEGNFDRAIAFFGRNPILFIFTLLWYLAGQGAFWVALINTRRQRMRLE